MPKYSFNYKKIDCCHSCPFNIDWGYSDGYEFYKKCVITGHSINIYGQMQKLPSCPLKEEK